MKKKRILKKYTVHEVLEHKMPKKQELITKVVADLKELASLQKPELESTEKFPHYNVATSQLLKLKNLMMRNETPEAKNMVLILRVIDNFLAGEQKLKSEFPEMIHKEQLPQAEAIHKCIIAGIAEIKANLQLEPTPTEEKSAGLSM